LFNRFKEKLSSFKDALSSKLQEKIVLAKKEEQAKPKDEVQAESANEQTKSASKKTKPPLETKSRPITNNSNSDSNLKLSENSSKPKSKFSIFEKAKSLVFEQEIIIDEKDLTDPMWALEMALLESDVALPVAEKIVASVKSDLVGHKKKIGADTGQLAEDAIRSALMKMLSENYLD
jgi:fused signal recognition particle receptor